MLFEIKELTHKFYGLVALDHISLQITSGELVGLIGPNGSGKTTLFNCVTGFLKPTAGRIIFRGEDITNKPPHTIAMGGITRTFQQVHVFSGLSVTSNLLLALQQHQGERILASFVQTRSILALEQDATKKAIELLEIGDLLRLKDEFAGNLSYGQQKILAFLSALMPNPELILLDEPASGVNPTLINKFTRIITELNNRGLTLLVVEHNMDMIMSLCRRIIVLDHGVCIADGTPGEIRDNREVLEAYFGG